jgi:hypothetical protein
VVRLTPSDAAALANRAKALMAGGDFERAAADLDALVHLQPSSAWALCRSAPGSVAFAAAKAEVARLSRSH